MSIGHLYFINLTTKQLSREPEMSRKLTRSQNVAPQNYSQYNILYLNFRFGVCCLFQRSASASVINQNCTYITNEGFPNAFTGTTSPFTFTVNKCSNSKYNFWYSWIWTWKLFMYLFLIWCYFLLTCSLFLTLFMFNHIHPVPVSPTDVCALRLDFESFTIAGPLDSFETDSTTTPAVGAPTNSQGGSCLTDSFTVAVSFVRKIIVMRHIWERY